MNCRKLASMEGTTSETAKPSAGFQFNPHRKSHLRGHTYSTLLRILSHCNHHSRCSHGDPVPDHGSSGLERLTENEVDNELVAADNVESEDMPIQKDPIVHASSEGMPLPKDPIVDESAEVIGFQEVGSSNVQVIIDDLEQITRGEGNNDTDADQSNISLILSLDKDQNNSLSELEQLKAKNEDNVADIGKNIDLLTSALDKDQDVDHIDTWIKDHVDFLDLQHFIMEEDEDGKQVKVSSEQNTFENLEGLNSSVDDYKNGEDSKADENNSEKGSPFKGIAAEDLGLKVQEKETELKKSVSPKTASSPLHIAVDGDIEEGEISGDFMGDDDLSFKDDEAAETKKGEEESIPENIIDKEAFTCNEQKRVNDKDSESTYKIISSVDKVDNGVKVTESERQQMRVKSQMGNGGRTINGARRKDGSDPMTEAETSKMKGRAARVDFDCPANFLDNMAFDGESLDKNAAENLSFMSVKEGTGVTKKRKRELAKERRAKNKQKERKKRAEKNRELGVKRPRLPPVSKPKTVTYCTHYLKGKCQKGAECRFSHDTIPLTKSKPCTYFARGSCMKGDDCQFDHQLSKYSCDQYFSKGFCRRSDDCLFSHEMPPKEGSPTVFNACKPVSEPPSLPRKSNSKKLNMNGTSHQNAGSLSHSVVIAPPSNVEKKVAETVLKPPGQAPRGINFLSFGKSPMDNSSKLKQVDSVPKMELGVKVGNQKNLGEVQNMNKMAKRAPVSVPPWGINFLSLPKASLNDSSVKELVGSPSNREDADKISPLGDSNKYKQVGSSSTRDGRINISNQLNQSATETFQKLNDTSSRRQPVVAPPGINFLSSCKASLDDMSCKRQSKSLSQSESLLETPIQARQSASGGFQNSSVVPWGLSASPITSVSDQLVHGHNKDTSSSAPKALFSTLAFAVKYESALKMERSIVATPSVSMEANKQIRNVSNGGNSQNKTMKASEILDSLFGSGGKTK